VIGGPFSADIEQIIRDRAFLTQSPVISACDPGIKSITKCIDWDNGKPYQCCDISIKISNDMPLSIELCDVNLKLLGDHQRQNAVTASCTALCLRNLGWDISEASIQAGLEGTQLPGRSQILTREEALLLGLDGATTVLIDGGLCYIYTIMYPQWIFSCVFLPSADVLSIFQPIPRHQQKPCQT